MAESEKAPQSHPVLAFRAEPAAITSTIQHQWLGTGDSF
jgi:hypothetical protein